VKRPSRLETAGLGATAAARPKRLTGFGSVHSRARPDKTSLSRVERQFRLDGLSAELETQLPFCLHINDSRFCAVLVVFVDSAHHPDGSGNWSYNPETDTPIRPKFSNQTWPAPGKKSKYGELIDRALPALLAEIVA